MASATAKKNVFNLSKRTFSSSSPSSAFASSSSSWRLPSASQPLIGSGGVGRTTVAGKTRAYSSLVEATHYNNLLRNETRFSSLPQLKMRGTMMDRRSFSTTPARSMFIQTEPTPNVDSLKFIPGQPVMGPNSGVYEFLTPQAALKSPLADRLFSIQGVKSVLYGPDFITVNKEEDSNWSTMKPEIFSSMMEFFTAGKSLWREGEDASMGAAEDTRILDTDSETVAMIKELLETRVRPAIQEDGGDIEYRGFDEGTGIVQLSLKGSCRGCDSSTVTLKSGIERMLMHYVPDVKSVEQVLGPEEAVAIDEFQKFEARLRQGGKTVHV